MLALLFILLIFPTARPDRELTHLDDITSGPKPSPRHAAQVLFFENTTMSVMFGGAFYNDTESEEHSHGVHCRHLAESISAFECCGYWTSEISHADHEISWTWVPVVPDQTDEFVNPALVGGSLVAKRPGLVGEERWVLLGGFWEYGVDEPNGCRAVDIAAATTTRPNVTFTCLESPISNYGLLKRAFGAIGVLSDGLTVIVYGGLNISAAQTLSDVALFTLGSGSGGSTTITLDARMDVSSSIGPRWGSAYWTIRDRVVVFGGKVGNGYDSIIASDIWWVRKNPSSGSPEVGELVLRGGIGADVANADFPPPARLGGAFLMANGVPFLFGGMGMGSNGEGYLADMWEFLWREEDANVVYFARVSDAFPIIANESSVFGNGKIGGRELASLALGRSCHHDLIFVFGGRGFDVGQKLDELSEVWEIDAGDPFTCDGIPFVFDRLTCSGNGTCVGMNECSCWNESRYAGVLCDVPVCFGIPATEFSVCHDGNGTCVGPDTCVCENEDRYIGYECSTPVCNGIPANHEGVCSNNGSCVAFDVCECHTDDYLGPFCGVPTCNDIPQGPLACNFGNGSCVAHDHCVCRWSDRYVGQWCDVPVCGGIPHGQGGGGGDEECGGHGECVAPNLCRCSDPDEYAGNLCQLPICWDFPKGSPGVCSDNGTCTFPNSCECWNESRYAGDTCEIPVCNGILAGQGACSDNGTCEAPGYCFCPDPSRYVGQWCEIPVCDGVPANVADPALVCHGHGNCILADECWCDADWGGEGEFCGVPKCGGILATEGSVCSGRGPCVDANECQCPATWGGPICQFPECNGTSSNDSSVCAGNGVCLETHECACPSFWWGGEWCEISKCDNVLATVPTVCNGMGECQEDHTCDCDLPSLWGGFCNITICDGILDSNKSLVCSGRGDCIPNKDRCDCLIDNDLWGGEYCDVPKCFGSTGGCQKGFACVSPNLCSCPQDRYSPNCAQFKCFGILEHNKAEVCNSGIGTCMGPDVCVCPADGVWYGDSCEEEITGLALYDKSELIVTVSFAIPGEEEWLIRHGFNSLTIHHFHCSVTIDNYQILGEDANCGFASDFSSLQIALGKKHAAKVGSVLWLIPVSEKTKRVNVTISVPVVPRASSAWVAYFLVFSFLGICVGCIVVVILIIYCIRRRKAGGATNPYGRLGELDLDASFLTEDERRLDDMDDYEGAESLDREDVVNQYLFQIPMKEVEIGYLLGQKDLSAIDKCTTVYKSTYNDDIVVMKIIKLKALFRHQHFALMEEQLSLMTTMNHPNLVHVKGFSVNQPLRQLGIVTEFLSLGDLKGFIETHKKGFIDFSKKIWILRGVASALEYLHSLEILHRFVRPEKTLLGKNLDPKMTADFGAMHLLNRIVAKVRGMEFVVEGHYVAPEVTLKEFVGVAIDVFSFGMYLFEMLTENFAPFGEDEFNVQETIANDAAFRPSVDESLYLDQRWYLELMTRCWSHSPDRRPSFSQIKGVLADRLK